MAKLFTLYGLAQELGVSVESLQRWLDDGVISVPRRNGSGVRVFTERQALEIRRTLITRRVGRLRFSSRPLIPRPG